MYSDKQRAAMHDSPENCKRNNYRVFQARQDEENTGKIGPKNCNQFLLQQLILIKILKKNLPNRMTYPFIYLKVKTQG